MQNKVNKSNTFNNRFIPFDKVDIWANESKFSNHPYVKELKNSIELNNSNELNHSCNYNVFFTNNEELNKYLSDDDPSEMGLKYNYPYMLEIFGKSSIGKTQTMMQLLVSTLINLNLETGESLYISTEDNTKILYRRFKQMFDSQFIDLTEEQENSLLQRIKFLYCRNLINFIEYQLEDIILANSNLRYMFIDSISNDLRHINDNILKYKIFSKITELSFKYKLMVFVTNQVFTFIDDEDEEQEENKTELNQNVEIQQQQQINPCMTYDYQLKHITNPLFFNRLSLGNITENYKNNNKFEVPTMGYLFNNFVNCRIVLFNMGAKGERFLRILYCDSWDNSSFCNSTEMSQLKYEFKKNGLINFEKE